MFLPARAKLNLGLWVGRRRPDGYHDIVTTMVPLELHDDVSLRLAGPGIRVSSSGLPMPSGPANLAHQAAAALFAAARREPGCRIRIRKRIPAGAGLGGGSSDAAAVLRGLNRLLGRPLSGPALRRVAATLGSDVPFFLENRPCVARGRGELLRPISLPRLDVVLCYPGYPVSTRWAYGALDRTRRPGLTSFQLCPKILGLKLRQGELKGAAAEIRNSFEPVVFRRHPDLADIKATMLRHGAQAAALSGSGSTVYGLVHRQDWQDPMAALRRHGLLPVPTRTVRSPK